MDGGQRVWAPHPSEGYQLGTIVDVGTDTLTVEPLEPAGQVPLARGCEAEREFVFACVRVSVRAHAVCQS